MNCEEKGRYQESFLYQEKTTFRHSLDILMDLVFLKRRQHLFLFSHLPLLGYFRSPERFRDFVFKILWFTVMPSKPKVVLPL